MVTGMDRSREEAARTISAAAAQVLDRPAEATRRRAPKQEGRRAQLTIPSPVWNRAEELAELIGTTPNDVLAIFASKGMLLFDRQLDTAQIGLERVAAYRGSTDPSADAEMPSFEELDTAAEVLRSELDSSRR